MVGWIRYRLGVTHHPGVEDNFAGDFRYSAKTISSGYRTVIENYHGSLIAILRYGVKYQRTLQKRSYSQAFKASAIWFAFYKC